MTEENGKHWLLQVFCEAVEQTYGHLTRSDEKKLSDALMTGDHGKIKRLILNKKIDINTLLPPYDQTPLLMAVEWGAVYNGKAGQHKKTVSFLLEHKASTSVVDSLGRDVWSLASGNREILALLPEKPLTPKTNKPLPPCQNN